MDASTDFLSNTQHVYLDGFFLEGGGKDIFSFFQSIILKNMFKNKFHINICVTFLNKNLFTIWQSWAKMLYQNKFIFCILHAANILHTAHITRWFPQQSIAPVVSLVSGFS